MEWLQECNQHRKDAAEFSPAPSIEQPLPAACSQPSRESAYALTHQDVVFRG